MQCRICDNSTENREYRVREMMFGTRETYSYHRCSYCGCVQMTEIPDDLSSFYPDNYYAQQPVQGGNLLKRTIKRLRNRHAVFNDSALGRKLYKKYPNEALRSLSYIPLTRDSRILDAGCGQGVLLHDLQELGFRNLLGVDPFNAEDITYENGLQIRRQSIHEVEGEWDLVMMHHAFEHVPDPAAVLSAARGLLAEGGQCLLRIPVSSSFAFDHFGEQWVQWDAPRHLYLHTRRSMEILAEQSGLWINGHFCDSTAFQFWGSLQYQRDIPLTGSQSHATDADHSPFTTEEIDGFTRRARYLNAIGRGDQAVFLLGKTGPAYSSIPEIPARP